MPTRRKTLLSFGNLAILGFGISSSAFNAFTTSPSTNFQIIVITNLQLKPGREDDRYVEIDDEGLVDTINLDESISGAQGINSHTRTRFESLVELVNNGNTSFDRISFEFVVTDTEGERIPAIEDTLQIVSTTDEIDATGEENFLDISESEDVEDGTLGPGDSVHFGIQINLLPDSEPGTLATLPEPDTFDVELKIIAIQED